MDEERPFTQQSPVRRYAGVVLRFFLTFAVLAWLVRYVDVRAAIQLLLGVSPGWLAFSIVIMMAARFARCGNWAQLLKFSGFRRTGLYGRLLRLYFAGGFLGAIFPSTATADAIRVALAQRLLQASLGELTATAVLLNGITCLATCTLGLVGVGLLVVNAGSGQLDFLPVATSIFSGLALVMAGLLAGAVWLARRLGNRARHTQIPGKVRVFVEEIFGVVERLDQPVRRLAPLLVVAVGAQFCIVLSMIGLGMGIGVSLPLAACVVAIPLTALAAFVPASVLGFGAVQLFNVYFFQHFGIGKTEALAVSALQTTVAVGTHIVIGASVFCSLKNR